MFSDQMKTEAVTQCIRCAAAMPVSDNFCRSCGIDQRPRAAADSFKTTALSSASPSGTFSSVLVNTIAESVAAKTTPLRSSRLGIRLVAGLVVIPIWLLIILLSPIDAFAAAKAASSQPSL